MDREVGRVKGREGEGRERRPATARRWENLRGQKAQESSLAPTRTNHLGCNEGYGWFGGRKPLRRRHEAEGSCGKARERKGTGKPVFDRQAGEKL